MKTELCATCGATLGLLMAGDDAKRPKSFICGECLDKRGNAILDEVNAVIGKRKDK